MIKQLVKYILTWVFSGFNIGIWYNPRELDSLLFKLKKFKLIEESNKLQLVYHEVVFNEALQTLIMALSLCILFFAHAESLWRLFLKIKIKLQCLKNKKK
jgi:hypothetical protein